jgi:hypothetical protein
VQETLNLPVTNGFPDLSRFMTIIRDDGGYLLGAGELTDGLIVPLFPDEQSAQEVTQSLSEDPRGLKLRVAPLGDPFKAMRKAAGEGAAGFQFSSGLFTEEQRKSVFEQTEGRVLFPFMTRREEAGGQWPTVLGSASRCDTGTYLTRRGPTPFGAHDLCQWVRWDVMDRASAKLAIGQPLRSHDPGQPFWCLSHAPGDVQFIRAEQRYAYESPAAVLFASDTALRQFMPPEGYYPVFTSEEDAREFLERRLGGAFHIISLAESAYPNLITHEGLKAQELGEGGALIAVTVRIDNLLTHLKAVRETFKFPPYACFVLNPAGHREDVAWGRFADVEEDSLELKSVGARWKLLSGHQYAELERIDTFDGDDTFFLGPSEFRFAELRRSVGHFSPILEGEDLRALTATEMQEVIHDFVILGAGDPLIENVMDRHIELDIGVDADEGGDRLSEQLDKGAGLVEIKVYAPLLYCWVLNYWDTIDGERMGAFYLDTPFHLARALSRLEIEDRRARVTGRCGRSSIGFDGSGSQELEDAAGAGLAMALVKICQRMVERGYRPSDALDMAAAANAVLKSFRVSLCSNVADALISHIPDNARPSHRLTDEMGLPEELRDRLVQLIEANVDSEGDELLRCRVGEQMAASLTSRTRLFLTTALLQFDGMGKSPCVDYAPVSVQVVKALEFEMRELAAAVVCGFGEVPVAQPASREEETFFHILANRRDKVSLGSITYALKATRKAQAGILWYAANRLKTFGSFELTQPRIIRFIINDVLNRFRNAGAHEQAITYATCQECIDDLIGSHAQPGLIFQVNRWRYSPSRQHDQTEGNGRE